MCVLLEIIIESCWLNCFGDLGWKEIVCNVKWWWLDLGCDRNGKVRKCVGGMIVGFGNLSRRLRTFFDDSFASILGLVEMRF